MKGVTDAKSLRNLRTATTHRIHAKPPQRGTAHLEMYLLSMERQRLEQELAHLEERRERIGKRLATMAEELARFQEVAQQEEAVSGMLDGGGAGPKASTARPSPSQAQPQWKRMPLEY